MVAEAVAAQAVIEGLARKPHIRGAIAERVRTLNRVSGQQQEILHGLIQKKAEATAN
jgi:malate dehydrogenase (oxaloacetate-decarboxylating)